MGCFASKIGISLGFYWTRVTGLNVIDSLGEETVKRPNGTRFGWSKFAKKPMPAFINMPALVKSMQHRPGMNMIFSTRHADAVSFWSFLMMMTWQSTKNAASSGHNSSPMPTTLFNPAWFLLASASFSADLMQHHDLQIRFYRWHLANFSLFWYSITRTKTGTDF